MSWIFLGLMIAFGAIVAWIFNGLVKARNLVAAGWADVDVQLQRRHDLVPRLVKVVSAYAEHEKETLEAVTRQRDAAIRETAIDRKSELEAELDTRIHQVVAIAEAYPDLKAGESFLQLQGDLVEIEDDLQFARRFYNGAVRDFNNRVQRFPDLLAARFFGFENAAFFQADARAQRHADLGSRS